MQLPGDISTYGATAGVFAQPRPVAAIPRSILLYCATASLTRRCGNLPILSLRSWPMRRRNFLSVLGGAAAWPLGTHAQQPERMRRIGVLMTLTADDPEGLARVTAFAQGLQELGWRDGRDVRIDYRWAAGDAASFHRHAQELLTLGPHVNSARATS